MYGGEFEWFECGVFICDVLFVFVVGVLMLF